MMNKKLRIALNATCINARPSGAKQRFVGLYTEIIKKLPHCDFYIFEPADYNVSALFDNYSNVYRIKTNIPSEGRNLKLLKSFIFFIKNYFFLNFDIYEGFHLPFFKFKSVKTLLTIHDIRSLDDNKSFIEKFINKLVIYFSIRNADHLITVSNTMKNDILYHFPNSNVSVIYNGLILPEKILLSNDELLKFNNKYKLPSNFILSIGHLEKRKNYPALIQSFSLLINKGMDLYLVIVGNDSGEKNILLNLISELNLNTRILFLHSLSDFEVNCVYNLCTIFVFPSLYEGFGIPILEAMAADKPFVLSNIEVFREITENRLYYFDPYSVSDIANKIEQVLISENLQNEISTYSKKRINDFYYFNISQNIINLYYF